MMAFKDRLRQARNNAELTQNEVANMLGIAKSTYSGYETGKSEPSMHYIASLMRIYSVSADFLWQDDLEEQFDNEYPNRYFYTDQDVTFSEDERKLLQLYRQLNTTSKHTTLAIMEALAQNPAMQRDSTVNTETVLRRIADEAETRADEPADESEARA